MMGHLMKQELIESSNKEAVILIPCFGAKSQNQYLDYLVLGLTTRLEGRQVSLESEDIKIKGQSGKRLTYDSLDGKRKTIDIYEAYWNDLINPLSSKNIKEQVIKGFFLLLYWLFSRFWHMARKSRILFAHFMILLLLNVLWYYGNLTLALTTIGQNPGAFGLQLPSEWAAQLVALGKFLGGWQIWVITSCILGLLPVPISSLVDLTDFTARYLQDETQAGVGGIRDRTRQRVVNILNDIIKQDDYSKVTILAHSFGVTIGIDLIADYRPKTNKPIRYISMGGAIELMSYKSAWVMEEAAKCLDNPLLTSWNDYYSDQDWICTKTPTPRNAQPHNFKNIKMRLRVPLAQQIVGGSHDSYFFERPLLEDLLDG